MNRYYLAALLLLVALQPFKANSQAVTNYTYIVGATTGGANASEWTITYPTGTRIPYSDENMYSLCSQLIFHHYFFGDLQGYSSGVGSWCNPQGRSNPHASWQTESISCTEGEEPNEDGTACETPQPEPEQPTCEQGYTNDIVTGECVLEDGNVPNDNPTVGSDENNHASDFADSLNEAMNDCAASGSTLIDFTFYSAGDWTGQCGFTPNSEPVKCATGTTWMTEYQQCMTNSDADHIADAQDPDPDDPSIHGDTDGDTYDDEQDFDPNDSDVWFPNTIERMGSSNANPTQANGESTNFNDSAIVGAINETNRLQSENNSIAAETANQIRNSNALLSDINDNLKEKDGTATNNEIIELINKSSDELGIRTIKAADTDFVQQMIGSTSNSGCTNPVLNGRVLDLCSLAPKVLPFAEFILWIMTSIFLYHELHSTIRRAAT